MQISESPRLEATAREYEMRGLHEHSTYDVTVAAVTSKGEIKSHRYLLPPQKMVRYVFKRNLAVCARSNMLYNIFISMLLAACLNNVELSCFFALFLHCKHIFYKSQ